jgi:hypothetical protein
MFIILELLVGCIQVMLLFFGAILTFVLGESLYKLIDNTLFNFAIPCMEMLSLIIAVIAPIAYFFGIHHQKGFFQRESKYNKGIFFLAFLFGAGVTFLPIIGKDVASPFCAAQITLTAKVLQALTTGGMTALIAFLSFDMGVYQSLYLTPVLRRPQEKKNR